MQLNVQNVGVIPQYGARLHGLSGASLKRYAVNGLERHMMAENLYRKVIEEVLATPPRKLPPAIPATELSSCPKADTTVRTLHREPRFGATSTSSG